MSQTKSVNQLRAEYESTISKNGGKHFYDRLHQKRADNPKAFDDAIDAADLKGAVNAEVFMDKVRNFKHPQHAAAVAEFNDTHGADTTKVRSDMTKDALKAAGVQRLEFRNLSYENNLVRNMVKERPDEAATVENLRDLLQKKACAVGYDGDAAVVDQFRKEFPNMRGVIAKNIRK